MKRQLLPLLTCLLFSFTVFAQSPGLIVRPAGGNGATSLNTNGDGYVTTSGSRFLSDDIAESELAFKVVPAAVAEPTGDLLTGPTAGFTDIVTRVDGSGFYLYKDATNIYFRLRIGSIVNGSKGYSVLIDTDGKMGGSGPYADPNYVAPSGTNPGNPGFEYEVVLQTNFQVAVYNIDGTATPGSPTTYSLNTNSQISVALSTDSNNPDYFYDWFVPLSAIGNPTSIRMATTTVTSPNSALQGTRSDIYGINDGAYANTSAAWQTVVNAQPFINLSSFSGVGATCTAAPALTGTIAAGALVSVGGTWTRLDASKPSSATITLYKNGTSVGTTTVNSGNTWNITVPVIANGDVFYAKAQATGETQCLQSNSITASACLTPPATPVITCASLKGISGTMPSSLSGNAVLVYLIPTTSASPTSNLVSTILNLSNPTTTSFSYYTNGCSGGSNNVATGVYMLVTQNGSCTSPAVFVCVSSGSSGTPPPLSTNSLTITQPVYPSATSISGSGCMSGDILRLFINGQYQQTITASSGSFSFTGLSFNANDQIQVYSQTGASCMTQSSVFTVSCFTQPPVINVNATGNLLTGATTISGTSAYTGASVQLYKGTPPSGVAVSSAATVNSSGVWSVTVPALVGNDVYYAIQTNSSCASAASSTATVLTAATCPTITGTYSDAGTTISGTMPSSFTGTIRLYEDGALIGSQSISASTLWSISVAAGTLYYNGVLSGTAQATGGAESSGCGTVTVGCTSPLTPSISPGSTTINTNQTVTFTVNNVSAGSWYGLLDNTGKSYATSAYKSASSSFSLTTNQFTNAGTYNLKLTADALSGCPASFAAASITVNSVSLPVHFVSVNAVKTGTGTKVSWTVSNEVNVKDYGVERSVDGITFINIGNISYQASTAQQNQYSFTDNNVLSSIRTFYRIRQTDNDGHSQYSNVVSVANTQNTFITVTPNPAISKITVSIPVQENTNGTLELLDFNGKTLLVKKLSLQQGGNTVTIDNLGSIARGNYMIKLSTPHDIFYKKILLQ